MTSYWSLYCQVWTDFTYCSGISIVDFEQVNSGMVGARKKDFGHKKLYKER